MDLVCVALGLKPVALIENDFLPNPRESIRALGKDYKKEGDEVMEGAQREFDFQLRYVASQKCNLQFLVLDFSDRRRIPR